MKVHFSLPDTSVDYDHDGVVSFLLLRGSSTQLSWQFSPRNISSIVDAYTAFRDYLKDFLSEVEPLYETEWSLYVPWPVSCLLFSELDSWSMETLFLNPFDLPEVF